MSCRPSRLRRLVRRVRRSVARLLGLDPPLAPPNDWGRFEPALVPVGPPSSGPRTGSVALELPRHDDPLVYPTETDAVGKDDDLTI
jgi:hypothetical protein